LKRRVEVFNVFISANGGNTKTSETLETMVVIE